MRQYTYMNTESISGNTYSGGSPVTSPQTLKINKTGYITEINGLVHATTTTAETTDAPAWPSSIANLIDSMRVYSGATNFFSVDDGRELFWDNFFHYRGKNMPWSVTAQDSPGPAQPALAVTAGEFYWGFKIHLGNQYYNPYDPSVVIPARELQSLNMEITWRAQTQLVLSDLDVTLMINEIQLDAGESRDKVFPAGMLSPRMEANTLTPPSTTPSNLAWKHECPVGDTLVYTVLLMLDNNVRSDALLSEIGIEIPKMREKPWRVNWYDLIAFNKMMFGHNWPNLGGLDATAVAATPTGDIHYMGAAIFPWSWISGKPEGLDVSAYLPGDIKMSFSGSGINVSQDTLLVLHYLVG